MKKRFLSILTALSLALSLLPGAALANGPDDVPEEGSPSTVTDEQPPDEVEGGGEASLPGGPENEGGETLPSGETGSTPGGDEAGDNTTGGEPDGPVPTIPETQVPETTATTTDVTTPVETMTPVVQAIAADDVAAIGDKGYGSLDEAISAAKDGETVVLLQNITLTASITITGAIGLDLNGKTLGETITSSSGYPIRIAADAALTIQDNGTDGRITSSKSRTIYSSGNLDVTGGTIESTNTSSTATAIYIASGGKLSMSDGTAKSARAIYIQGQNYIDSSEISNGTVEGSISASAGTLTVTGGQFTSDVSSYCGAGKTAIQAGGYYTIGDLTAENAAAQIDSDLYATVLGALCAADNGDIVTVLGKEGYQESASASIGGKTVTLSLGENTLNMGSATVTLFQDGNLNISGAGQIIGEGSNLITLNSGSELAIDGSTISCTGSAVKANTGGTFTMSSGTLNSTGSNTLYITGGTATVTGGRIVTDVNNVNQISVRVSSGTFILGNQPASDEQTLAEAQKVYVEGLQVTSGAAITLTLNSGIVGDIPFTGVTADMMLNCWFEKDTIRLPVGKECRPVDGQAGYFKVVSVSVDPVAEIGDTQYYSIDDAEDDLEEGDTLKLIADLTGNTSGAVLEISVPNVTVDLNGHSVTNTHASGDGVAVRIPYGYDGPTKVGTVLITNSDAEKQATVTAATPLSFSGGGDYDLTAQLGDGLVLTPAGDNSQSIEIGNGAILAYSEAAAALVGNGGFRATHADGNQYIYGNASAAIKADKDHTATLLNDYTGTESLSLSDGYAGTIDLNDHTYTYTENSKDFSVIEVLDDHTNLTIRNGSIISTGNAADGAQVGVSANVGGVTIPREDVSLTLDNVDFTVASVNYGIVANGTCSDITLTLRNGTTLNAPNAVAIYWPSRGNSSVTIENSTVIGHTGVQICAGSLTVNGAATKIQAIGDPQEKDEDENDGCIHDGSAVSIIQRTDYGAITNVSISDGQFIANSASASAINAYHYDNTSGESDWEDAGKVVTVSGGSFSDPVTPALLDETLKFQVKAPTGDAPYSYYANMTNAVENAPAGSTITQVQGTDTPSTPVTPSDPGNTPSSSVGSSSEPSYSPVQNVSEGGTIRVSPRTAEEGDEVTITPDPDAGYEVADVTVTRNGRAIEVTANRGGTYTFTQPAGRVTIDVTFQRIGADTFFTDVPETFWAYDEIAWAYENGYVNGVTATTFNPNGAISRQQVWMILARLSGYDPADMAAARTWAMENGVSDGTNPGNAVTRQQLVALLFRFAELRNYANDQRADLSTYPDAGTVAEYAVEPMQWSVANDIVGGTTAGTLNPEGTATRAQFAVILYRFWSNVV